jgi:hypothetical protein
MFPLETNLEAAATPAAALRSAAIRHPSVAIGLTIVLAFLATLGILAYVTTSRAGELLLDWGEKMGSGFYSQPIPPDPVPPASSAPDSA